MGCIHSINERQALANSKRIDLQLKSDKLKDAREVKLLLLGAGESGKSTVVKQMKIIHENGYSNEERIQFLPVIFSNTIQSMVTIIKAMNHLEISFGEAETEDCVAKLMKRIETEDQPRIDKDLAEVLKQLWTDSGVQSCYKRSREYQLNDSAGYYFNILDRISADDYLPTDEDLLKSRVKTTGILEYNFTYQSHNFVLFDVGGQRSERKKWIHCFDNVRAIIFVVAMSAYDMLLVEDGSTNRMHEALTLFESIAASQWFLDTSIILFLNKKDLLMEKISQTPLTFCFPAFTGPNTYESASTYIQMQFERTMGNNRKKDIYSHFTCATDTNNIKHVFDDVTKVVMKSNLQHTGMF